MRPLALLASLAVLLSGCVVLIVVDESTRPAPAPTVAAVPAEVVADAVTTDTTLAPHPAPTP